MHTHYRFDSCLSVGMSVCRNGTLTGKTEDEIWQAKFLYDSAFHPDTKEKMFILGRMSAQVPCNMAIVGNMVRYDKSPATE